MNELIARRSLYFTNRRQYRLDQLWAGIEANPPIFDDGSVYHRETTEADRAINRAAMGDSVAYAARVRSYRTKETQS